MFKTTTARRGMFTAPHHLATQSGLGVLREGGNAVEAMVAAAATIGVVYPHMNSFGGDGFWLIKPAGEACIALSACGVTGANVTRDYYRDQGVTQIPTRGPLAANTVAGTISGWHEALSIAERLQPKAALPVARLLEDAIDYARHGFSVSAGQTRLTEQKRDELIDISGFADRFLTGDDRSAPQPGSVFVNTGLASMLQALADAGLDDFYRGDVAQQIAKNLDSAGSPINLRDLQTYRAEQVTPLSVQLRQARVYNLPPPTQGLASLIILALYDRMVADKPDGFDYLHRLVEATKQAFLVRDNVVTDPAFSSVNFDDYLQADSLDKMMRSVDLQKAMPWPHTAAPGDTIWMGTIDGHGNAVSFIQSIYWEFGSGVVLPDVGLHWQNRGCSFSLDPQAPNALSPQRKPFHTLNPALAEFSDGRIMSYGTMGGEGQPQTQAAVFSRYAMHEQDLQQSVSAARWLLGRTWGEESTSLKLESNFDDALITRLIDAGHQVEITSALNDVMGHAGAVVRLADGTLSGATDPRSDGLAAGF